MEPILREIQTTLCLLGSFSQRNSLIAHLKESKLLRLTLSACPEFLAS